MKTRVAAGLLLALGCAQMAGDLLDIPALKGIGAASLASPAPRVFSAVRGLETYSTRFFLEWRDRAGSDRSLEITPTVYARLAGPYNRRNMYGAALAYGPILYAEPRTRPMLRAVINHALTGDALMLRELGIDPTEVAGSVRIRYEPRPGARLENLPLLLEAPVE